MPYVSGVGSHWFKDTPGYLSELGYDSDIDPIASFDPKIADVPMARETLSALYDASLRSTDEAMGRIFSDLQATGEAGNTLVGICGDHGEEIGEHGDFGHRIMHYEHNSRIPMMFKGSMVPTGRQSDLVTTMDFAPSLTAFAGGRREIVLPEPQWHGRQRTSDGDENGAGTSRGSVVIEAYA